jgi:hypothetical protein
MASEDNQQQDIAKFLAQNKIDLASLSKEEGPTKTDPETLRQLAILKKVRTHLL